MKTFKRSNLQYLFIFIIFLSVTNVIADPPDPGGPPVDPPMGGSAPIGGGFGMLLSAGLAYLFYHFKHFFMGFFSANGKA